MVQLCIRWSLQSPSQSTTIPRQQITVSVLVLMRSLTQHCRQWLKIIRKLDFGKANDSTSLTFLDYILHWIDFRVKFCSIKTFPKYGQWLNARYMEGHRGVWSDRADIVSLSTVAEASIRIKVVSSIPFKRDPFHIDIYKRKGNTCSFEYNVKWANK